MEMSSFLSKGHIVKPDSDLVFPATRYSYNIDPVATVCNRGKGRHDPCYAM